MEEVVHFFTHFDGTLITSLKTILSKPGKMAEDFCNGIRRKYFKPLSFFLLLVILYLLFPILEGLNMRLHYYKENKQFGSLATRQIEHVLKTKNMSEEELSEIFHQKGEKTSKFLLFLVIPVMALVSKGLAFKKRKYYFDHFIFSAEASSFYLLWGFLIFPLILVIAQKIGWQLLRSDDDLIIAVHSVFAIYVSIAAYRFFKFSKWYALVYSLLYTFMMFGFVLFMYKLILFEVVLMLV